MDRDAFLKKAQDYCLLETHDHFRNEVETLLKNNDLNELTDRFYTELSFGTGGLRGIIGGGYNRMNPLVVRKATQGLANYVNRIFKDKKSAVIAFDSRHYSEVFALEAAGVLCGNGITTYVFTSLRPTPELSFAVRMLEAKTGIVITASHNPPEYNGYKVYWDDGSQVIAPHDEGIIREARTVSTKINSIPEQEALARGLLIRIDKQVDSPFLAMVKQQILRPEMIKKHGKKLKLVYTPLHGTGLLPIYTVLTELGLKVTVVPEQKEPDGDFPTVTHPNPEEAEAMQLALKLAAEIKADLVMGTDPDADRLGIAVRVGSDFPLITGNQLGVLLTDYLFSSKKELGILPERPALIKTIVTTELQRLIAERYQAVCYDTLTGFKYICAKIRDFEKQKQGPHFVFGNEESYGYLIHDQVRDKDAVTAAVLTAEMALFYLLRGKTLVGRLEELFYEYGYFEETQVSKYFAGQSGMQVMQSIMEKLRTAAAGTFAGRKIVYKKDYLEGTTLNIKTGEKKKNIDLPPSNVIQLILEDETIISARPSGTEPKIKFYASCRTKPGMALRKAQRLAKEKISLVSRELHALTETAG
jgi:phosphoglucomutase